MTQVLLGQSYYLRFDPKLWVTMQPYPPLGTLYAASVLRERGYDVSLFDAMLAESEVEWERALEHYEPYYAVLFEDNFNYLSKMCLSRMRQAAYKMITMAKQHGAIVILCGADATDHAEEYLLAGADYVMIGEGEQTLVDLLAYLDGKSDVNVEDILGLAYRAKDSSGFRRNPRRPDIQHLDDLSFPAWDLVDVDRYRDIWLSRHGYFSMNMVTTRGCPFHCNWCAKPIWGQRYNTRSPENVVAEIKWLKELYAPDHIWFADDIFGLKPGWLTRFAELIQSEGVSIPFKCLSRADLVTRPGEVDALRAAGAHTVWVGAESGAQQVLDAMDKGTRVGQIYQAAKNLQGAGIRVGFFLQFGYPGETWSEIRQTIQMVRECGPDDIGISVSYPMPGTRFFEAVRDQMGTKQNWQDSNDLAMLYHGTYTTAFYRQLHKVVHTEFRARKAWQELQEEPNLKDIRRFVYNLASLPIGRLKLNLLSRKRNPGLVMPHLPPEQASQPSIQNH